MARTRKKRNHSNSWSTQLDDLIRGVSGSFLFGTPLLYTMEVWWIGSQLSPPVILAVLFTTLIIVFLLNRTAGFRKTKHKQFLDTVIDSIEALAIGIICAGLLLILLREIQLGTSLNEALGKLILESVPFSLGAALADGFLSGDRWSFSDSGNDAKNHESDPLNATLSDIGATLIGATIIALNIAPTDEIPMLSAAASPPELLLIIVASLLISYIIVFAAGFTTQQKRQQQQGIFQRPISETVASYLISLIAAALMLFFFKRLTFEDPWMLWLSYTIILGLPASIGGAAGRIAI
jgi:putative integral membrane protein (TIGR02587 family)